MSDFMILYLSGFFSSYFYYQILKEHIIYNPNIELFLFFYIFIIYFMIRFLLFLYKSFHFNK